MIHEDLLCVRAVIAVFLHCLKALVKVLAGYLHGIAEVESVKREYILGNHHKVISRAVVYYKTTLAVVNQAARRIDYFLDEGVGIGVFLVLAVAKLQHKEADDVNYHQHDNESANGVFTSFEIIIFSHALYLLNCQFP